METLIAILISLLGYGSPSDYEGYTEDQLNAEIQQAESTQTTTDDGTQSTTDDGGVFGDWDSPSANPDDEPSSGGGE